MSTLRKLALGSGFGVLLLAGAFNALAADPTPKELFEAVWTSGKPSDLDEATYVTVSRNPKSVVKFIEIAFSHANKQSEQAIVDAALKALRDLGTIDCDVWVAIASEGVAKSDEDDKEYMIAQLAAFLNPGNCPDDPTNGDSNTPPTSLPGDAANASPIGGVGTPQTLETFTPPPSTPPAGGGGGTAGPPFEDDDDPPATGTGAFG